MPLLPVHAQTCGHLLLEAPLPSPTPPTHTHLTDKKCRPQMGICWTLHGSSLPPNTDWGQTQYL